jgi:hypothetical protein
VHLQRRAIFWPSAASALMRWLLAIVRVNAQSFRSWPTPVRFGASGPSSPLGLTSTRAFRTPARIRSMKLLSSTKRTATSNNSNDPRESRGDFEMVKDRPTGGRNVSRSAKRGLRRGQGRKPVRRQGFPELEANTKPFQSGLPIYTYRF